MKKIIVVTMLAVFIFGVASEPAMAATSKNKAATTGQFFHKRKLVHKKAPIPKDPKVTKADLKKARQQAIAGQGYVKVLKGWLKKKAVVKNKQVVKKK